MKNKELLNLTNPQLNILEVEKLLLTKCNHILVSIKFNRKLNTEKLKKTINKIIALNDNFQIKLEKEKDSVKQYFEEYSVQEIEVVNDIQNLNQYIEELNKKYIDIYEKLYEFKIVNYKKQTYVLYKAHHIINDAWGVTQIGEQIKEIYPIIDSNNADEITKRSYKDLINTEKQYFNSSRYSKDKEFWNEYVKELSSEKLFNKDVSEIESNRIKKIIDPKLYKKIIKYCKEKDIGEYSFFLGILAIYYKKIYNINNLNVGTPFLNRNREQMEIIGLFITNLPLNIKVKDNQNFIELCKEIYRNSIKVFRRSKFPYKEIQKLYSTINTSSNMFEVGYSFQLNKLNNTMQGDLGEARWYFSNAQTNPITIHIYQMEEDLEIFYDYIQSVIDEKTIILMHKIILHIIEQVLLEKDKNILDINVLPKEEKTKVEKFNSTGNIKEAPLTISEVFDKACKKYSRKTAIKYKDQTLTYSNFYKKVCDLAHELRTKGIKRNMPVMLFFDKSFEMIISMFAVIKAGGCYVPVLPEENKERIKYILDDCNPIYILTSDKYKNIFEKANAIIINIDELGKKPVLLDNINSLDDILYIIYTSGSTGNPKGTKVLHKNVQGLIYSMLGDKILRPKESDISMSLLKYSFDASGIDIYSALLNGGKLILISKDEELNPNNIVKIMEKEKVTRSFLVPKWLEHINVADKKNKTNLSKLRILGTGGEVFKPKLVENLFKKYPKLNIVNLYGPTETTMFSTYNITKQDNIENDHITIGRPIKYSRAYIVNNSHDILPTNTKGELMLAQDVTSIKNIAQGYLNLDEITESKFIEIINPFNLNEKIRGYKTGDIALINDKLELEFIGRTDDIIKVNNGYLVSLNEVENRISTILGGNERICVIPINANNTKSLVLFIESSNKYLHSLAIKKEVNTNISFYMRIKDVVILSKFPLNNSGKINRKELKTLAERNNKKRKIIFPETKNEKKLHQIFKKQCDLEQFSIHDDFIDDLSIDSLDLSVIYSLIDDRRLKMQDLYTYTTIHDLAHFIDNKKETIDYLRPYDVIFENNTKPFNLKCVMILGSTGFLGIHILIDMLKRDEVKKIYCLVRNKADLTAKQRVLGKLNYYFNNNSDILESFKSKVKVIEGDVNKPFLGLEQNYYEEIRREVTVLVNSAANVNHYGKYEKIYNTNVSSVKRLIEFCGKQISLAHISTLSIAGFKSNKITKKIFDEDTLYINQDFNNNPYLITKFQAEQLLLSSDINVKIFRVGNIMPRNTDGKFQENYKQNAFINAIRIILKLEKVPKSYLNFKVEFSPVEECADAIVRLIVLNSTNKVYHVLSDQEIEIQEVLSATKNGENIKIVNDAEFVKSLQNYKEIGIEYVKEYILQKNVNEYSIQTTMKYLQDTGFAWSNIEKKYFKNLLKIIKRGGW